MSPNTSVSKLRSITRGPHLFLADKKMRHFQPFRAQLLEGDFKKIKQINRKRYWAYLMIREEQKVSVLQLFDMLLAQTSLEHFWRTNNKPSQQELQLRRKLISHQKEIMQRLPMSFAPGMALPGIMCVVWIIISQVLGGKQLKVDSVFKVDLQSMVVKDKKGKIPPQPSSSKQMAVFIMVIRIMKELPNQLLLLNDKVLTIGRQAKQRREEQENSFEQYRREIKVHEITGQGKTIVVKSCYCKNELNQLRQQELNPSMICGECGKVYIPSTDDQSHV